MNRKGFTLIELLVVIVIIAILALLVGQRTGCVKGDYNHHHSSYGHHSHSNSDD